MEEEHMAGQRAVANILTSLHQRVRDGVGEAGFSLYDRSLARMIRTKRPITRFGPDPIPRYALHFFHLR